MKKIALVAMAIAASAAIAFAQDTVTRTERTEVTTSNGTVTQTSTQITTVIKEYVTYLRRIYTSVGVSEEVIVRVIRIDIEILVAYVQLDFERVRVLTRQEVEILTPAVATRIVTY